MILNAYSILDGLTCVLRLALATAILVLSVPALRKFRTFSVGFDQQAQSRENSGYLLFLLGTTLFALNILAWPLFYLVLQSYVPQWPGVMCIYGVTKIGIHSVGSSRFLPSLIDASQILKPAVVFAGGSWFVLYLVNRRTPTSALFRRTIALLVTFGFLSASDAVVEAAYLVIPKLERHLDAGCCVGVSSLTSDARGLLSRFAQSHWLPVAYYAMSVAMAAGLLASQRTRSGRALPWLFIGALISLPVSALFLVHFAAPTILHLPYHHCAYDLVARQPETIVGIGFFFVGAFSVGWACLMRWLGQHPDTHGYLDGYIGRGLYSGAIGYLAAMIFFSVELTLC